MGKIKPFTQQEFNLAMYLATDTRAAYKSKAISERELREKFDYIRSIIHYPPMNDEHFTRLKRGLNQ